MVLACSTTSILSMLLLLLMLFNQGLQAFVLHSDSCHSSSGTTAEPTCNYIANEILNKLPVSELTGDDTRARLRNVTLQRANMDVFLRERTVHYLGNDTLKTNLEKLECCLSASASTSVTGIYNPKNLDDFQKKLRYYVSSLENLKLTPTCGPPHPTSGDVTSRPVTSRPVTTEC